MVGQEVVPDRAVGGTFTFDQVGAVSRVSSWCVYRASLRYLGAVDQTDSLQTIADLEELNKVATDSSVRARLPWRLSDGTSFEASR